MGPLSASHLYREDHIVYSSAGETMGTYRGAAVGGAADGDDAGSIVPGAAVVGEIRAVNSLRSSAPRGLSRAGTLVRFQGSVEGNPLMARVAVEYELRDLKSGTTVWSHYYAHDEPISGKDVSSVVAALDRNVQGIVGQVKSGLDGVFCGASDSAGAGQ